jgi:hypothetical protein
VVLSYLASYDAAMGTARVQCVAGCKCEPTDIDALWGEKASMLMTAEFAVGAAAVRGAELRDANGEEGGRRGLGSLLGCLAGREVCRAWRTRQVGGLAFVMRL